MKKSNKAVFVTEPYLPPLEEFIPYLESIWSTKILTNGGTFHKRLEDELSSFLGVQHVSLFNNGTIALITALQALGIRGEVITTPYSFVATANSLLWNNISPVFVDIDKQTFNINPLKIEEAITDKTTAILAVHCYGNPCDVEAIQDIASKHNLKIIYDAAHAFGVQCHCGSLLNHGDLSILSFHATKVYNTFEGGAIISKDISLKKHIDNLKNFGFIDETTVIEAGINGKMSEINAAMGLLQLKHYDYVRNRRQEIANKYLDKLRFTKGICIPKLNKDGLGNFSYFPILIEESYGISRDELYEKLKKYNIYSRRYFYPLISQFPMYSSLQSAAKENLKVAQHVSRAVLCLPIHPNLLNSEIDMILEVICDNK